MGVILVFLAVAALSLLASNPRVLRAGRAIRLPELAASGVLFLALGAALAPRAGALISDQQLTALSPLVVVGLGLGGCLVGLNFEPRLLLRLKGRVYLAALVQSGAAFALVALPAWAVFFTTEGLRFGQAAEVAGLLGAIAAASSSHFAILGVRAGRIDRAQGIGVALLATLDDGVVLAALAVALGLGAGFGAVGNALAVGALAGLLLAFLARSAEPGELGALVLGCVALAAGAAAYLRLSALLAAVACGAVISLAAGRTASWVFQMLLRLERPFYLVLLFVIGTHVNAADGPAWVLAAGLVALRVLGKLAGGRAARFLAGRDLALPTRPGYALLAQGGLALCIAIEYRLLVPGPLGQRLLDVAAFAMVANELLGAFAFGRASRPGRAAPAGAPS